jgi:hypothetical protein
VATDDQDEGPGSTVRAATARRRALGALAVVLTLVVAFGGWRLLTAESEARLCTLAGYLAPPGGSEGPFDSADEAFARFLADDGAARAVAIARSGTTPAGPRPLDVPASGRSGGPITPDFERRGDGWEWEAEDGRWVVLEVAQRPDGWWLTGLNGCGVVE